MPRHTPIYTHPGGGKLFRGPLYQRRENNKKNMYTLLCPTHPNFFPPKKKIFVVGKQKKRKKRLDEVCMCGILYIGRERHGKSGRRRTRGGGEMKTKISEKITPDGGIVEKIIIPLEDFGPGESDRYAEMDPPELPVAGKTYLIWSSTYAGPNCKPPRPIRFTDEKLYLDEGFPGNSDHNIRSFHGWRGTTDDWSVNARGVRLCVSVERRLYAKTVHYHIVWGPDTVQQEE